MKKKILISMMTIAMVAAMIGGGVYAAFSDPETSGTNTFAAGTLNLQVGAADPTTEAISISGAKPATGTYINAADWTSTNNGNLSGTLDVSVGATITDNENTLLEPESSAGDVTAAVGELSGFLKIAIWLDINQDGLWSTGDKYLPSTSATPVNQSGGSVANPPAAAFAYVSAYAGDSWTNLTTLAAAGAIDFMVAYEFPDSTTPDDDQTQDDDVQFTVTLTLNQA